MPRISVDRLQPGVFVSLAEIGWLNHPFLLSQFRINSEAQVHALREMGLAEVDWNPERSTVAPLPEAEVEEETDFGGLALAGMLDAKRARVARVQEQREMLARREREFEQEAATASEILRDVCARPQEAHNNAQAMVGRIVDTLLGSESIAIHLVNMKKKDHLRAATRTPPEEDFYRAHVGYGIKAVAGMKNLATGARNVIACHHEAWDGSGFPNHLAGEKIPKLARVVAIANRYDNLCNPFDLKQAKTPAEALGQMFRQEGKHFDPDFLQAFVKTLGVFPPGSFVQLDNGATGLVIEGKACDLMHPLIMLYDPDIPRAEAILLDLADADLKIEAVISPANLPLETVEYLAPRGRIDYYVESG
ncbi:HD family phosphohydrolase [Betaproteobacteria bacterium]|nr:HD family phosphohydrolase [Betaproteobacteria bacterium]GHU40674.1 HD family phosphohydrolase [Betaproteobacteria bacterium]